MSRVIDFQNVYYGLVYKEQINKFLVNMGLTWEEADLFLKNAAKDMDISVELQQKFTGTDKQWDLLKQASKTAVNFSHALANFMSAGHGY